MSFVPASTVIWIKDVQFSMDRLQQCFEKALLVWDDVKDNPEDAESLGFMNENPARLVESSGDFLDDITSHSTVEFGGQKFFDATTSLQYNAKPQPSFNKNIKLLVSNLKENSSKVITNLIFTDNPRQVERFYSIFEDIDDGVEFFPIVKSIRKGFIDMDLKIAFYTDHEIFDRFHKYHIRQGYSRSKALMLKALRELKKGDFVTHIDHGVGTYSGLEKIEVRGKLQEAIRIIYRDNDLLYVNINSLHKISKYVGKDGTVPKINKLGSDAWEQLKRKTKKKVKDIAKELIKLYAERKAQKGFAFSPDSYLQSALESSFIYEDTPDQEKATEDVKRDMEKENPMDRLVCGDVGFGKTEIAIRAAFKAVADSKQVAVLVPTTILALQHNKTFKERLADLPCTVDYINRFKSRKQISETTKALEEGKLDILIGTHGLVGKNIKFKDLGLLIIDEEQKFGVATKEKLRQIKANVDTLTLTATPIPRTLQFSMMGARDLSIINTPPPNRQPIHTELQVFNDELIKDAIYFEVNRGGQAFLVHNRVKNIDEIASMVRRLCPDVKIAVAHGQMEGVLLEKVMSEFIAKVHDVLICTNIVESGLDIPNANTIIINNAHQFGLSDLHQLRGRVGRSNKKAFCYLITPSLSSIPTEARKRLTAIEEFSDLGSGFNIAMRDLDIRGAGNLLGGEQSGFIAEIGFEMYHKILDEAITELKETEFKTLFAEDLNRERKYVRDCQIDTDMELLIPDNYITNINERLSLYSQLDNLEKEEELIEFQTRLRDRFGNLPRQVKELCDAIRLRWLAKALGFERIMIKKNVMKCYFLENQESPYYESKIFAKILDHLQRNPQVGKLKQTNRFLILIINDVNNLHQSMEHLQNLTDVIGENEQQQTTPANSDTNTENTAE